MEDKFLTVEQFYKLPRSKQTGCVKYSNGTKAWFKNRLFHREDGPAREFIDGDKEYWLNNKRYSYTE